MNSLEKHKLRISCKNFSLAVQEDKGQSESVKSSKNVENVRG